MRNQTEGKAGAMTTASCNLVTRNSHEREHRIGTKRILQCEVIPVLGARTGRTATESAGGPGSMKMGNSCSPTRSYHSPDKWRTAMLRTKSPVTVALYVHT